MSLTIMDCSENHPLISSSGVNNINYNNNENMSEIDKVKNELNFTNKMLTNFLVDENKNSKTIYTTLMKLMEDNNELRNKLEDLQRFKDKTISFQNNQKKINQRTKNNNRKNNNKNNDSFVDLFLPFLNPPQPPTLNNIETPPPPNSTPVIKPDSPPQQKNIVIIGKPGGASSGEIPGLGNLFSPGSKSQNPFDKILNSLLGISPKEKKTNNIEEEEQIPDYTEYDSDTEIEDLGLQIKSIDDIINLGDLYTKLKEEEDKITKEKKDEELKKEKAKEELINDKLLLYLSKINENKANINKEISIKSDNDKDKDINNSIFGSIMNPNAPPFIPKDKPFSFAPAPIINFKIDDQKNKEIKEKESEIKNIKDGDLFEILNKKYSINLEKVNKLVKPLKKLKNMVGLEKIKNQILDMILYYLQGFENKNNNMLHTVIEGPPGVGKTQLGKILAEIYSSLGIIPSNTFKLVKRTDLIGEYVGHTAHKTQAAIDEADGGVLFIDEAYSLGNKDKKDSFSKECIDTLNQNLSENKKKFICIIAGYPDELESSFFSYNPGLKRRFPFKYKIDKYTPTELKEIFMLKIGSIKWKLDKQNYSDKDIQKFFEENKDTFSNYGGDIDNIIVEIKFAHSRRVINLHPKFRRVITKDDIMAGFNKFKESKKSILDEFYKSLYI